jgi:hemerythrin-like domain-containing protein
MEAIEMLMAEHRIIEQVLVCLEKLADKSEAEKKLDAASAIEAVDFLRTFADKCHHAKEENRLFRMLETKGMMSRDAGPTAVMRAQHEQSRGYVRAMSEAAEAADMAGSPAKFARAAREYAALLRAHIQKEDQILYPAAERMLSPKDQRLLMDEFELVEHGEMGEGTHEKMIGIANRLADRFGVTKVVDADEDEGGCCGHHHGPGGHSH